VDNYSALTVTEYWKIVRLYKKILNTFIQCRINQSINHIC